ncbi:hypothetical protein G6M78_15260 [Agrobacterium tumefaciens]|uniref:hypothetical protein n=1 Tax=Agrobacterium tumefaciens TaxID=358 RepID=UPI001572A3F2|nr:hypothetical protein [Agrobacterium tumefaciens]NTE56435.1 hypothetical protein [Agrobacterium tumefaciens]NTE74403.1 hypothetical protein [Agrobacterium tumefaciens]
MSETADKQAETSAGQLVSNHAKSTMDADQCNLTQLERFPVPIILASFDDIIVFANQRAQNIFLSVDMTDMPIDCFILNWTCCCPASSQPQMVSTEVFLRDGSVRATDGVVFKVSWGGSILAGISIVGPLSGF